MGAVGGTISLWSGASVLTIVQLFVFLVKAPLQRKKSGLKKKQEQTNKAQLGRKLCREESQRINSERRNREPEKAG